MFNELKYYFDFPITCKKCGKKMRFGLVVIFHLWFAHKIIDKTTIMWALRRGLELRILLFPFILIYYFAIILCWPFWWVYEHFGPSTWW